MSVDILGIGTFCQRRASATALVASFGDWTWRAGRGFEPALLGRLQTIQVYIIDGPKPLMAVALHNTEPNIVLICYEMHMPITPVVDIAPGTHISIHGQSSRLFWLSDVMRISSCRATAAKLNLLLRPPHRLVAAWIRLFAPYTYIGRSSIYCLAIAS